MTVRLGTIPEGEAGVRWRAWQVRGAAQDRRTAARMRVVVLLMVTAFVIWVSVLLA
jgi:hypothetical protein